MDADREYGPDFPDEYAEEASDESPLDYLPETDADEDELSSDARQYDELLEEQLAAEREDELEQLLETDFEEFKAQVRPKAKLSPGLARLARSSEEAARERLEEAARTVEDFEAVIAIWDRMDANRERRERYREIPRGEVPLEYGGADGGLLFPRHLMLPEERQRAAGYYLDIIFDCPYEMHELSADRFYSNLVNGMSEDHKELLCFLYLRRYKPNMLAAMHGQTDRNIRKVRDTMLRQLRKKLYKHLKAARVKRRLNPRECSFVERYEAGLVDGNDED